MSDDFLLPRHLGGEVRNALSSARVVNVIGPRQAGKTTLVRDLLAGGYFVSLDDTGVLAAIEADPYGQLQALAAAAGEAPVIIDEAQRSSGLALAIKRIVDEQRRMGQFLLTGSSNVFAAAHVTDSLAGRVTVLALHPLSAAEIHRRNPPLILDWAAHQPDLSVLPPVPSAERRDYIDLIIRGGYPEIRNLGDRQRNKRYRDAIDAIVDRDVADILKVRKSDAMRRLIDQLAAVSADELHLERLCSAIGIQRNTLEQYLDVLTRLSLIARLGAWASGTAKREVKRPKLHLLDTGIAASLRGFTADSFGPLTDPTALGHLLESYVYNELAKNLPYQAEEWRLWHWRNPDGREVDIVAECDRRLVAVEVKAAATLNAADSRNLQWFKSRGPGQKRRVTGIIFYLGDHPLSLGDHIFGLPLSLLWGW
ncbi:MAG: ATP-binding protein [Desulfurivibrio sp.]